MSALRLEIRMVGRQNGGMRALCSIMLAFVVALATSVVPVSRAAHAASPPQAPVERLAAPENAAAERGTTAPAKRCQSGAGMLACPFLRPSLQAAPPRQASGAIRFETSADRPAGRAVSASPPPPKTPSA